MKRPKCKDCNKFYLSWVILIMEYWNANNINLNFNHPAREVTDKYAPKYHKDWLDTSPLMNKLHWKVFNLLFEVHKAFILLS